MSKSKTYNLLCDPTGINIHMSKLNSTFLSNGSIYQNKLLDLRKRVTWIWIILVYTYKIYSELNSAPSNFIFATKPTCIVENTIWCIDKEFVNNSATHRILIKDPICLIITILSTFRYDIQIHLREMLLPYLFVYHRTAKIITLQSI